MLDRKKAVGEDDFEQTLQEQDCKSRVSAFSVCRSDRCSRGGEFVPESWACRKHDFVLQHEFARFCNKDDHGIHFPVWTHAGVCVEQYSFLLGVVWAIIHHDPRLRVGAKLCCDFLFRGYNKSNSNSNLEFGKPTLNPI